MCAAANSPRSDVETLRSLISWRGVSRTMRTTRLSALPYWLAPSSITMRSTLEEREENQPAHLGLFDRSAVEPAQDITCERSGGGRLVGDPALDPAAGVGLEA